MFRVVGNTYNVQKVLLEEVAQAAFSYLGLTEATIELKFVSEREIIRLNTVYRHKKAATDVLSFNIDDKPLLGQVFICYTFTKRSAKALNKPFNDEVALLLAHGILHVAGYDHELVSDEANMQAAEKEILERVGIVL